MNYKNIIMFFSALFNFACAPTGSFSTLNNGLSNATMPVITDSSNEMMKTNSNNCGLGKIHNEVLNYVNTFRASGRYCGRHYFPSAGPLIWNTKLETASALHSLDMAKKNYFDHNSLNGDTFSNRIRNTGYEGRRLAENISAGRSSVAAAIQAWIQSPGHCANIMTNSFSELGVACAFDSKSKFKYFWTMDLGTPKYN